MNRDPISINADNEHYEALKTQQNKHIKDNDTHKHSLSFPIGSTISMQWDDDGPWTYEIVAEANSMDNKEQAYIIWVTKMDRLITHNMRHICKTLIMAEQYLQEQIKKGLNSNHTGDNV